MEATVEAVGRRSIRWTTAVASVVALAAGLVSSGS